ncbi:MAG: hypothetical protein ACFFD1_08270 [Candidatus Thorarchaeota archaeon]
MEKSDDNSRINIDQLVERRLYKKNTFFSSLALTSQRDWSKFISLILFLGFLGFILFYVSEGNEIVIGVIVIIFCLLLIPRVIGLQFWALEKSKYMLETSPKSLNTIMFTFVMIIRWFVAFAIIIIIPIFAFLGIIKTIFGLW